MKKFSYVILSLLSYLFSFEREFNEDLLQLLVDKVDAELLETVLLEDLESVDVQDANVEQIGRIHARWELHGFIYSLERQ